MRIAIIIPACNAAPTLAETLQSVLAQTHEDWRMVVVDDGSDDGTSETVAASSDPRICVVRQARAGVSAARNRGTAVVNGDAFLFLDADDCLAPRALASLAAALAANPHTVAATGAAQFVRCDGTRGSRRGLRASEGELLPGLLVRNRFANCGHVLIRRPAVGSAGGFHIGLSYGEDWEYLIRIAVQGPFAAVLGSAPLLTVRERPDGVYSRRVADPAALAPALDVIFANPMLRERFSTRRLQRLRRRAEAENAWAVGRALLRQGSATDGQNWLRRSIAMAPSVRRIALLAALSGRSPGAGG